MSNYHQEVHLHEYNPEGCEDCGSTDHDEDEPLGPCYWKRLKDRLEVPPGTICQRHTKILDSFCTCLEGIFGGNPDCEWADPRQREVKIDPCVETATHAIPMGLMEEHYDDVIEGHIFVCDSCYRTYKTVKEAYFEYWRSGYKRFGSLYDGCTYQIQSIKHLESILKGEKTPEELAMEGYVGHLIHAIKEGCMDEAISRITDPGMVGIAGPRADPSTTTPPKKMELEPKKAGEAWTKEVVNNAIGEYCRMMSNNRLKIDFQVTIKGVEVDPSEWDPAYSDFFYYNEDVLKWKEALKREGEELGRIANCENCCGDGCDECMGWDGTTLASLFG
tara:strand:- start:291 stop:1286 length:996 start_codon:yes stop_codon:yes gene_type:complete